MGLARQEEADWITARLWELDSQLRSLQQWERIAEEHEELLAKLRRALQRQ